MTTGVLFQLTALLVFLSQVPSCHAFSIPTIAIYGSVAGGALILVLISIGIAICIKKYRDGKKNGGSGDKKTKAKDVEKGKKTGPAATKKNATGAKGAKKDRVTTLNVKDEKKDVKTNKKSKADEKQKEKERKKEEKLKKKEEEKKRKEDEKKKKEAEKKKKEEEKKTKNNKDVKNTKDTKDTNDTKDGGKGKPGGNKVADKWKNAASKINTGKTKTEGAAPAKSSKVAWTVKADKNDKTKKAFGFGSRT